MCVDIFESEQGSGGVVCTVEGSGLVPLSYSAARSVRSTAAIKHKSSPLLSGGAQARGCLVVF